MIDEYVDLGVGQFYDIDNAQAILRSARKGKYLWFDYLFLKK